MQSVDEIYALLRTAGTCKQPVAAMYEGHPRWFCPHLLGRSKQGRRPAFSYQFGGNESKMSGAGRGGKTVPLGHQEPISCDAKRGVMVEPAPVTSFKVPQA